MKTAWDVDFHDDFVGEYEDLPGDVQDELLASVVLLERFGPFLGRPRVDTLNGSRHANMKELRFSAVAAFGGSPLLLTRSAEPSFCVVATSPVAARSGFMCSSSREPMRGLTLT